MELTGTEWRAQFYHKGGSRKKIKKFLDLVFWARFIICSKSTRRTNNEGFEFDDVEGDSGG